MVLAVFILVVAEMPVLAILGVLVVAQLAQQRAGPHPRRVPHSAQVSLVLQQIMVAVAWRMVQLAGTPELHQLELDLVAGVVNQQPRAQMETQE